MRKTHGCQQSGFALKTTGGQNEIGFIRMYLRLAQAMGIITVYIFFGCILLTILAVLSWIDVRSYRLPNILTLPLIAIGFLFTYLTPSGSLWSSMIGATIGYTGFIVLEYAFRYLYQKEGLGRGDAKLLAAGGAWCGWFGLPYILLIASLCGLVFTQMPSYKNKAVSDDLKIPFGPFLAFAIAVIWCGQSYLNLL